ncbi:hypothetical protein VTK56DRAFT_2295 [Thermocarpiscus australiensis]
MSESTMSSSRAGIPPRKHPMEQPEIVRAMIELGTLTVEDQVELSLANRACFRAVYPEIERRNVKTVPFAKYPSRVKAAIDEDDAEQLERLLKLGEFDKDKESPNARLLNCDDGLGIHLLMRLCINADAVECLDLLIRLAEDPATPFRCDIKRLYRDARWAAFKQARIECLLMLDDREIPEAETPSAGGFYGLLLTQVASPFHVLSLASKLPPDTDYMPMFLAQCLNRHSQPALLDALADLVGKRRLNSPTEFRGKTMTPLSALASSLHVNGLAMLLRMGVRPFEHYVEEGLCSASYNPLFNAISQVLPRKPYDLPGGKGGEEEEAKQALLDRWKAEVEVTASWMRTAVAYLVDVGRHYVSSPAESAILDEMLSLASLIYLHALRTFLLANLPWQLPERLRAKVLEPAAQGHRNAWRAHNPVDLGGIGEETLAVTWRRGLTGRRLRKTLGAGGVTLHGYFLDIWNMLATPETVAEAERFLEHRHGGGGGDAGSSGSNSSAGSKGTWNSVDALYTLLLATEREEAVPSSRPRSAASASASAEGVGEMTGETHEPSNAENGGAVPEQNPNDENDLQPLPDMEMRPESSRSDVTIGVGVKLHIQIAGLDHN